jgi:hypothetical protein
MTLADLRKVTVRNQVRIRFGLSNGMECVLNEHGIAQVPALRAVPSFNLEDELASAEQFLVEPATPGDNNPARARSYTREEMTAWAASGMGRDVAHDDHDE